MNEKASIDLMKKVQTASTISSQGKIIEKLTPAIEGLNSMNQHFASKKIISKYFVS